MDTFRCDQNTFRGYQPSELRGLLPQNSYVDDSRDSLCAPAVKRAPMSLYSDSMIPPPPDSAIDTGGVSSSYSKTDVGTTLERLRLEVEALRDSVAFRSRDKEERVYETIDSSGVKKRNVSHSPSPVYQRPRVWSAAKDRGFHRLRYVLDPSVHVCVRAFWVVLFVAAVAALVYQIRDRVLNYVGSPTNVNIDTVRVDGLRFPAVTICNENQYRLSASVSEHIYDDVSALSRHSDASATRSSGRTTAYNGTYKQILGRVAHQIRDFLSSCYWDGIACGPQNFTTVYTDYGVCYTFRADKLPLTRKTGPQTGLFLVLNAEQYEYLSEAKPPVGVKFVVHEAGEVPRVGERGVNAAVGAHTSVAITRVKNTNLPPPVGDCHPSQTGEYTRDKCLRDCERMLSFKHCGCVAPHLETTGKERPCDVRGFFKCVQPWLKSNLRLRKACQCGVECESITYESFLSHASTSVYAAESIVRTLRLNTDVEERVRVARDMQQRVDPTINQYDAKVLLAIVTGLKHSATNISVYTKEIEAKTRLYVDDLSRIKQALALKNDSIQTNLDSFKEATHIRIYSSTVNHFLTIFIDISAKAYNAHSSASLPTEVLNKTAWEILTKMEPVIKKTESYFVPSGYILAEIINGVIMFRNDIIFGYGQDYKQFKQARKFYNATTSTILKLVRQARVTLTALYDNMVTTTSENPVDLRKKLLKFFKDIHAFTYKSMPALRYQFDQLQQTYILHTKEIIKTASILVDVGTNFDTYYKDITGGLASVKSLLKDLEKYTVDVKTKLNKLSQEYKNYNFEKTTLSYRISGDPIQSSLEKIKMSLEKLILFHNLASSGNTLRDSLLPLALTRMNGDRIKLDWLKFSDASAKVKSISRRLDSVLKTMNDYESELREYARGNRLNEHFYMNNFLHLEVYFSDRTETRIEQRQTYNIFDLLCDIGGSLALYLGICLLTLFEAIDFILSTCCLNSRRRP